MLKVFVTGRWWLVKFLEWSVMLITGFLVLDVVWQVATRFILRDPSKWTEELARMILIWVSLMGAALAFERKGHLGVDYFVGKLNPTARTVSEIVAYLLVAAFSASVLVYGGAMLVQQTLSAGQPSPALAIEWGHVYLALPISGFFIVLFSMEVVIKDCLELAGKKTGEEISK